MRCNWNLKLIPAIAYCAAAIASSAGAFEGRIAAGLIRGTETNALLYTVGAGLLRIEVTESTWPHPVNLVDRKSSAVTLLFPHNRSFVRLKNVAAGIPATSGGDSLPPGLGPQPGSTGVVPALPAMPMPVMPMPGEKFELQATTNRMTILGFPCVRYQLKQRGETLEMWATDKLVPFQPYWRNQPTRFGPRLIEEQWPELLKARHLFPLLVILRDHNGAERFRFEVKSAKTEKITDRDGKLFQPPSDYHEIRSLLF